MLRRLFPITLKELVILTAASILYALLMKDVYYALQMFFIVYIVLMIARWNMRDEHGNLKLPPSLLSKHLAKRKKV